EICALNELSVNLTCSYSNINITTGFWFNLKDKAKWWKEEHPEDLTLDSDYAGRVRYTEMTNSNSTLTITDLRERDSGEYHLMFITDKGEKYQSSAGVTLTVTDLQVRVRESAVDSEGQTTVTLSCITSCTLSNNPTYMWYKNRQPVTNKPTKHNKLYLSSSEDAGNYSCALRGCKELRSP
ncbi:hypothetical protein C0J45_21460, partial [Silurus meridionalis]